MATPIGALFADLGLNSAQFATDAGKAVAALNSAEVRMNRSLGALDKGFVRFGRSAARGVGSIVRSLNPLTAGVGTLVSTGALALLAKRTLATASEIRDLAKRANIGTEALQELNFAASRYGVTQDALVDGLKELSLRADEFAATGKGPAADAFKALGLSQGEVAQQLNDSAGLFDLVTNRIRELDNTASRVRAFDEIFGGTGGEQLSQILQASAAEFSNMRRQARAVGFVISDKLIVAADQANDQFDLMGRILSAKVTGAVVQLSPHIDALLTGMIERLPDITMWLERQAASFGLIAQLSASTELAAINAEVAKLESERQRLIDPQGTASQVAKFTRDLVDLAGGIGRGTEAAVAEVDAAIAKLQDRQRILQERVLSAAAVRDVAARPDIFGGPVGAMSTGPAVKVVETLKATEVASFQAQKRIEQLRDAEQRRAEAIRASILTAQEEYNLAVAELNKLLARGLLSQEEHARAVGQAREALLRGAAAARTAKTAIDEAEDSTRRLEGTMTDMGRTAVSGLLDIARGADSAGEAVLNLLSRLGDIGARAVLEPLISDVAKAALGDFDPFGLKSAKVAEQAKTDVALNPEVFGGLTRSAEELTQAFQGGTTPAAGALTAASGSAATSLGDELGSGAIQSAAAIARSTAAETVAATAVDALAVAAAKAAATLQALSASGGGGSGGLGALAGSGSAFFNSTSSGARAGGGFGAPGAVNPGPGMPVRLQHGGSFRVGGAGGVDSQRVLFDLTPGEELHAIPPGERVFGGEGRGAGMTLIMDNRGADESVLARIEAQGRQIAALDRSIENRVDRRIIVQGAAGGRVARAMGRF